MSLSQSDGAFELTETAIRLSQVIEREAKRQSAMRSTRMLRMQSSLSSSFKRTTRKGSVLNLSSNSNWRRKSSAVVGPMPGNKREAGQPGSPRASDAVERKLDLKVTEVRRPGSKLCSSGNGPLCDNDEPTSRMQRLWLLMDDPQSSQAAYYLSVCIFFFVAVSTVVFIAQTEKGLDKYAEEFNYVETLCAAIFSVELLVRMLTCPSKIGFFKNYANWIDMSAIFPFYLETMLAVDNAGSFGALRIVRLTRVARVLKMSRYSSAIQVFVQAITISMKALSMLIFLMAIAMVVFSSMIYFAEFTPDGCRTGGWVGDCSNATALASAQFASSLAGAAAARAASSTQCICVDPNPYKSIASSFWWCIVTMSTVGYGDMTPVTLMGKVIGCASVLTGMLVLALPITVIGTNFQKVMKSVMQQTMKSNVDYLKGKRMICRNEIEAILQRFHAVTEGIHLDIDDVINVYDTDNSGMLENEELTKFRIDLEVLQNRFMMNQNHQHPPHHEAATLQQYYCPPSESGGLQSRSPTSLQPHSPMILSLMGGNTSNAVFPRPLPSPKRSSRELSSRRSSALASPSASSSRSSFGPGTAATSSLSRGSKSSRELPRHTITDFALRSPSTATNPSAEPSFVPGDDAPPDIPSPVHSPSNADTNSSSSSTPVHTVNEELFWNRMLDMHRAWEDRLLETEQRLEAKLNNLTKILIRMEGMMELSD